MNIPTFFFKFRSYTPIPLILILLYQSSPVLQWIITGLVLIILGESTRFWAILYAGGATRTRNVGASELVTAGPYGLIRNPLYLGNIIIYLGVVFVAGGPWMWQLLVITLAFFTWQYSQIITLEEDTLLGIFGEEYRQYQEHVPRIFPRFSAWHKPGDEDFQRLSVGKALKPEKSTLINIGMMLILIFGKLLLF